MLAILRSTIGRKLFALIITPILTGTIITINAFLPEGSRLTTEQITHIVEYLIGLAVTFIAAQGTVDTVAAAKKSSTPIAPTNVMNAPIPDDMK